MVFSELVRRARRLIAHRPDNRPTVGRGVHMVNAYASIPEDQQKTPCYRQFCHRPEPDRSRVPSFHVVDRRKDTFDALTLTWPSPAS
jgi:hypothetical protein